MKTLFLRAARFGWQFIFVAFGIVACDGRDPGMASSMTDGATEPVAFNPEQSQAWRASQDHWRLINYWAEWCKPCVTEIPELNELHAAGDVVVFGYNYDGLSGDKLESSIQRLGIEFEQLSGDPADHFALEALQVLPVSLLITPAGELSQVLYGPQSAKNIMALIQ
ncbi:MAG: TlpA family protein disulfide reductase [Pseudomonadales bacterium]|nr:TlpA family protein disulfide reductase [Pseudomonadales bacterium]